MDEVTETCQRFLPKLNRLCSRPPQPGDIYCYQHNNPVSLSDTAKDFWVTLPSNDLKRTLEFYTKLGFVIDNQHTNQSMVTLLVGAKKIIVNFFPKSTFQGFTDQVTTDTSKSNEVILSLSAASPSEVDAMAQRAVAAGGYLFGKPRDQDGWMYSCGFADPDGHRWAIVFMDFSKMPK
jgi:hypothetical protein